MQGHIKYPVITANRESETIWITYFTFKYVFTLCVYLEDISAEGHRILASSSVYYQNYMPTWIHTTRPARLTCHQEEQQLACQEGL